MLLSIFSVNTRPLPRSTLFPYTTLFRSAVASPVLHLRERRVHSQRRRAEHWVLADLSGRFTAGVEEDKETRRHGRSEEHTSELQSPCNLVCRLLLEKKKSK